MTSTQQQTEEPLAGPLELVGRITTASNATFLGRIGDVQVVYKPVAGERPLWDFPDGTLARRELATYLLSEEIGWNIVPTTWLREGPFGEGMVQLWQEPDGVVRPAVALVPADHEVPDGWCHVLDGLDETERPVSLLHEDSAAMRRMAVLDVLANNADRKGGHVLEMPDGHRYGVDHGVTFNAEPRLRTILWGWVGQELDEAEIDGVSRVRDALDGSLGIALGALLDVDEVSAFRRRCDRLLAEGVFPEPEGEMPPIPWPPL
ncbi:SCO1664 family protein [Pseudactinotalea terrae]|uniref:SCO1664 family protein n=1 Tax=Pseudactinotalea terrae TaxID=1743262 RepID=UPI0012E20D92|nr:SCO1664 family protein [Pseudactinotalea terrae]